MDAAGILTVDAGRQRVSAQQPRAPKSSAAAAAAGPPGRTSAHSAGLIFMRLALERGKQVATAIHINTCARFLFLP